MSITNAVNTYKQVRKATDTLEQLMSLNRKQVASFTHEEYAEYIRITNEYITSRNKT